MCCINQQSRAAKEREIAIVSMLKRDIIHIHTVSRAQHHQCVAFDVSLCGTVLYCVLAVRLLLISLVDIIYIVE